ncbi:hypothetical protein [Geothrix sp. SG200]|uniref:hypothetical protein n=1 Tax=Geothrix sp. SG200 TaxID=2922865 RepID=UPI001FACEED1|nr:hypothetical protein [Geothrix sp. SG200]
MNDFYPSMSATPAPAAPQSDPNPTPAEPPTEPSDTAKAMYPSMEGAPGEYRYEIPPEFEHLGLVHDLSAQDAFSAEFRKLGLTQSAVNELVGLHLRHHYGSKK